MVLNKANPLSLTGVVFDPNKVLDQLSDLHFSKVFGDSPTFKDFRVVYNSLCVTTKLCFLCFAVFPANEVIKKRLLVHWWIGEGFLNPPIDSKETVVEIADGVFEELTKKGCIEPVYKKRRSVVHSFKMHPLIRSAVIVIAKEVRFFDFDSKGNPTANFSWSHRACLMNGSSHLTLANRPDLDPEKLQIIFNVNEAYPDFSKVDWSRLRNVKVLYLGRWHSRANHHIEVDDIEFFKGMRYMRHLIFFSLRGISRIMELPDSLCKLSSLRILDLSACHNLETLPEKIGSLKMLTHLDMSECYLLEHMPKGIALLSELKVLKGFIICDHKNDSSCTLHDLSALKKLRKLTINTSREDFPREEELIVFQQFGSLRKLTIAWGGLYLPAIQPATSNTLKSRGGNQTQDNAAPGPATPTGIRNHIRKIPSRLPTFKRMTRTTTMNQEHFKELEKLDLQCYPQMTASSWLMPGKLKSLKKLYVRGGQLQSLGQVHENDKWTIRILRLKFLSELKMDWNELQVSFPDLIYLEKFRCPKLTFFPCDASGLWLKP
ncbi:disease resistance RPP13-like protein 4 [Prunus yedoensis var. nudiflora]|uniref:Disease resistance RPP13-like protein 4 n=1 Tax=Prunus yedoensis var. nudiflora TaxID=2094558 RepID=A0A314UYB6_PRUYE|nr:disease resistance RPP13-like protein 4 [Prunus yedoensis var. nudiflora]